MPLQTINGINFSGGSAPAAAASGLKEWGASEAPAAADFNKDLKDLQEVGRLSLLAGLLAGGVCTAAALVVSVPVGTEYYARAVWKVITTAAAVSVTDNATTYIWGCSDGILRTTTSTTPPTLFDNTNACIIVKAVAVSGVVTLDFSVSQWARVAYGAGRAVVENASSFAPAMDTIPSGVTAYLPSGSQQAIFNQLSVVGVLHVQGRLRITT